MKETNIIRLLVNMGRIQKIQGENPASMSSKAIKMWLPNSKKLLIFGEIVLENRRRKMGKVNTIKNNYNTFNKEKFN